MNTTLLETCAAALEPTLEASVQRERLVVGGRAWPTRTYPRGLGLAAARALHDTERVAVLPYASPEVAQALRRAGVPFVDAAGNAYLRDGALLVSIEGRRPTQLVRRGSPSLRAGGLQLVFTLLTCVGGLDLPYRELSRRAGVALGTVANTMAWLRQQGHVAPDGAGGWALVDGGRLRERWELGYAEVLRETLRLGRARPVQGRALAEALASLPDGVLLGGELAAERLGGALVATRAALHVDRALPQVLQRLRLVPDPDGTVDLFRRFGDGADAHADGVVHPLLIAAELRAAGDPRLVEAARALVAPWG